MALQLLEVLQQQRVEIDCDAPWLHWLLYTLAAFETLNLSVLIVLWKRKPPVPSVHSDDENRLEGD